jgi:hypothetical protein
VTRVLVRAFLFLASVAVLVCPLAAQDVNVQVANSPGPSIGMAVDEGAAPPPEVAQTDPPANTDTDTDTDTALPVDRLDSAGSSADYISYLNYGASFSQGGALLDTANTRLEESFTLLRPDLAIVLTRQKFSFIVQAAPMIGYYASRGTAMSGFLDPSVYSNVMLSRRWSWYFWGDMRLGAAWESLDTVAPLPCSDRMCPQAVEAGRETPEGPPNDSLPFTYSNGIPSSAPLMSAAPDTSGLAVKSLTQTVFELYGLTGLSWQRTRRQRLSFSVGQTYSSLEGWGTSIATVRVQASNKLDETTTLTTYGHIHQYHVDNSDCTSYGAGAALTRQVSRRVAVAGEVGPEFGSSGCGKRYGLNYAASLQGRLASREWVYFSAGRDPGAAYLPGTRWADNVEGGFRVQIAKGLFGGATGSYLHANGDFSPAFAYSGYLAGPQIQWRAKSGVEITASCRHFERSSVESGSALPTLNRNFYLVTLSWWHHQPIRF